MARRASRRRVRPRGRATPRAHGTRTLGPQHLSVADAARHLLRGKGSAARFRGRWGSRYPRPSALVCPCRSVLLPPTGRCSSRAASSPSSLRSPVGNASSGRVGEPSCGDGFVGSSGDAVVGTADAEPRACRSDRRFPASTSATGRTTIDWRKVAATGKRFAFLKATDGHDYLDPTFSTNRAVLGPTGCVVGAYHFARPTLEGRRRRGGAVVREPGRPASPATCCRCSTSRPARASTSGHHLWARRWVAEVRRLTGVTPLMYTSPYGWAQPHRRLARARARRRAAVGRALGRRVAAAARRRLGRQRMAGLAAHERRARRGHRGQGRPRRRAREVARADHDPAPHARGRRRRGTGDQRPRPAWAAARPARGASIRTPPSPSPPDPDDDAYFTGWGGACTGDDETCTITMRGNRSVRATFVTDITAAERASAGVRAGFDGPVVGAVRRAGQAGRRRERAAARAGGDRVAVDRLCRSAGGARCRATARCARS